MFNDRNHNGRQDLFDRGLAGRTVNLINADTGELVASTITDLFGRYRFTVADGLSLGTFHVQTVLPTGWVQTTKETTVSLVKGDTFIRNVNLGEAALPGLAPATTAAATPATHAQPGDAPLDPLALQMLSSMLDHHRLFNGL